MLISVTGRAHTRADNPDTRRPLPGISAALCFLSQCGSLSRASSWSLEDFINGVK